MAEADDDREPQDAPDDGRSESRTRRWSKLVTFLAACLALVIGLSTALAMALVRVETSSVPARDEAQPAGHSSAEPLVQSSLPTLLKSVPVYYVGRTDGLLYREFHDLASQGGIEETAVAALFNVAPLDPDYESYWSQGTVLSLDHVGNRIVINLSRDSFDAFTSLPRAREAMNQLVYTVTAAGGDPTGVRTVQVLADGSPALPVIGVPSDDFGRTGLAPVGRLWLTSPENQASLSAGEVRIALQTHGSDAAPSVMVTDTATGKEVPGARVTREGEVIGWTLWRVHLTLQPGNYEIRARQDAPGQQPVTQNRTIRVQ